MPQPLARAKGKRTMRRTLRYLSMLIGSVLIVGMGTASAPAADKTVSGDDGWSVSLPDTFRINATTPACGTYQATGFTPPSGDFPDGWSVQVFFGPASLGDYGSAMDEMMWAGGSSGGYSTVGSRIQYCNYDSYQGTYNVTADFYKGTSNGGTFVQSVKTAIQVSFAPYKRWPSKVTIKKTNFHKHGYTLHGHLTLRGKPWKRWQVNLYAHTLGKKWHFADGAETGRLGDVRFHVSPKAKTWYQLRRTVYNPDRTVVPAVSGVLAAARR
jgi:hypothetical protein